MWKCGFNGQWRCFADFIVNFEHPSQLVLEFLLLASEHVFVHRTVQIWLKLPVLTPLSKFFQKIFGKI